MNAMPTTKSRDGRINWHSDFPSQIFNDSPISIFWLEESSFKERNGIHLLDILTELSGQSYWSQLWEHNKQIEYIDVPLDRDEFKPDLSILDPTNGKKIQASTILKTVYYSTINSNWVAGSLWTWDVSFIAFFDIELKKQTLSKTKVNLHKHPKDALDINWESAKGWHKALSDISLWYKHL